MLLRKLSFLLVYINLSFLYRRVSCYDGSSLAFAIDDTPSMEDDINDIKLHTSAIIKSVNEDKSSGIKDFVLVTINDPDVILRSKTSSYRQYLEDINRIHVHNDNDPDCEENSLTGVQQGLLASRPGSFLFVFTDASAKDYDRVKEIKILCQRKQIQVLFVLTGDCKDPFDKKNKVYNEIAKACSGQVFRIKKGQTKEVLETIKILVKGQKSLINWTKLPRSANYVSVPFKIDEGVQYALLSTSGKNVRLQISSKLHGSQFEHKKITWNDNVKVLLLFNIQPGKYYAWVKGDSDTTLAIYGRSNFTFEHGFSGFKPNSLNDTSKQPIAGKPQHLSINVTDPDNKIEIKSAEILDMDDNVLKTLPLRKLKDQLYVTDEFLPPNHMFKIKIQGEVKKTGETISRLAKTPIEPQPNDNTHTSARIPNVEISEGPEISVDYGVGVTLTCKVSANPPLTIQWFRGDGTLVPTVTNMIENSLYISYLHIDHAKNNEIYTCKATNKLRKTRSKKIEVIVRHTSEIVSAPEVLVAVAYGKDVKINCGLKSSQPMTIKWFWVGKELRSGPVYSISADGSVLKIKSMDLRMDGKYTCEAFLNDNPTVKKTQDIFVSITGLERPVITSSNKNIRVMKGEKVKLNCNIIGGKPIPHMRWLKNNGVNFVPLPNENEETLVIPKAQLMHSGQYKCEAANILATSFEIIVVNVVSGKPEITVAEEKKTVPYGSEVKFTCKVESQPPLTVVWKDEKGLIIQNKVEHVSEYESTSQLKLRATNSTSYICVATSSEGSTTKKVDVTVLSPFEIQGLPEGSTFAKYGEDSKIRCNINSSHPFKVKWFWSGKELSNTAVHAISADGMELTLKSMDFGMGGLYTCEASLNEDPSVKLRYNTDVQMTGLEIPVIEPSKRTVDVKKGEDIKLNCKIISGKPSPQVKWYKKNGLYFNLIPRENREVLFVSKAQFKHAGQYKCKVKNVKGAAEVNFDVNINSKPQITIAERKITVPYDSDVDFTCKVESHPPPTISWKDEKGSNLQNEIEKVSEYEFVSPLKLRNLKKSAVYICVATNDEGIATEPVNVTVLSPFVVNEHIKNTTGATYGKATTLSCDINSTLPMTIKWYYQSSGLISSRTLIHSSNKHTILRNGKELKIVFTDLDTIGKYTCEASLVSDPDKVITYNTDVEIVDLAPPVIGTSNTIANLTFGEEIKLYCEIKSGHPMPQMQWFKKKNSVFEPISGENKEVLVVPKAEFKHAGLYKCEAKNVKGTASVHFNLTLVSKPMITIAESEKTVPYGGDVEFTCKVESEHLLSVAWKDEKESILQDKTEKISDYETVNKLKLHSLKKSAVYVCAATNNVGLATEYANVTVLSPFEVHDHIKDTTGVSYGTETILPCDINSTLPMTIKWYREYGSGYNSSRSLILSSDKYSILNGGTELKINLVDLDSIATYTCEAALVSDPTETITFSTNVDIVDLAIPVIEPTNKNTINVTLGEEMELNCKIVSGQPKPRVQWFKKNGFNFEPIPNENGEVLKVSKVQFKHSGQYKCEANNVKGTVSAQFDVNINSKPQITIAKSNINVTYGGDVELTCKVESGPLGPITVVWKDDKDSILNDKTEKISDYVTVNKLKLHSLKKSAVYVCTATNNVGLATEYANVTVLSPFEVHDHIKETTGVSYGTEKILRCDINSTLPMTIKWYRESDGLTSNRTLISSFGKHTILQDGAELKIKVVDLDAMGTYTCEAALVSDPEETITFSTKVDILDLAPPVIGPTNKTKNLAIGEEIELKCKIVSGQPSPQVQWFKKSGFNFEPIPKEYGEVLKISKAQFKHAGQYKCEAKNVQGKVSAEFDVNINSIPQVTIAENKRTVPYGSDVEFICKVESQPLPLTVVWKDEKGSILQKETENNSDYETVNKLKLHSMKKSAVYVCAATNNVGLATEYANVTVLSPFEVHDHIKDKTEVLYGTEKNIACDINSTLPITIKWYRQNNGLNSSRTLIQSSDKYSILFDGTELNIKVVDLDTIATYTCEASLQSDPNETISFSTDVNIADLAPPAIGPSNKITNATLGEDIKLSCKIISGQPKPQVQWFKKNGFNFEPISHENKEVLLVTKAEFKHAGQYRCEAKNAIDTVSAEFDVNLNSKPEITIAETMKTVPYGGDVEFTCKVESQPPLTIVWKDKTGSVVPSKIEKYSDYEFENHLKLISQKKSAVYACAATNDDGTTTEYVNVTVLSPFDVQKHIDNNTDVKYGTDKILLCDISSTHPMTIKWYRGNSGLKASRTLIHSSDKYTILSNGNELKIKSLDLDLIGTYTCEASLVFNPEEKVAFSTNVNIVDLVAPVVESTKNIVNVTNGGPLKLNCGIISGIPKPHVQWYKKTDVNFEPLSHENKEVLLISEAQFKHAGQYKCEANNVRGTATAGFDVNVNSKPVITITEIKKTVPYDSDVEFTCKAESQPPFTVLWIDEEGAVLQNKVVKKSEYEYVNQLKVNNVKKSAVYTCVATNSVGHVYENVTATVLSPFDVQNHIEGITRIKYGTEKILHCDIKSSHKINIQWYHETRYSPRILINASDTYSITDSGTELKIPYMDLDTVGTYTCEASLESDPKEKLIFSTNVNVVGIARPEITDTTTAMNGKNFTATCRIKGTPKPAIKWEFKPLGSKKFSSIPGSGEALTIYDIKRKDYGFYKCFGESRLGGIWHVFKAVVEEPPVITNTITNYYGVVGDKAVVISCNATGYPDPTFDWTREGNTENNDFSYTVKENTIYITNLKETISDMRFTCTVTNDIDTATRTFTLEVTENFENDNNFYGITKDVEGTERSLITILCQLVDEETRSVRWYKNGFLANQTGNAYIIENANPMVDNGNYTCRVNTDEGSKHETYVLDIGSPPTFYNIDVNTDIDWNEEGTLDCEVNAQPPANVVWSYNGNKLENINNKPVIDITDWGKYTCNASNVHGSIQRTFKVFTTGCYIKNNMNKQMPLLFDQDTLTWPASISTSSLLLRKDEIIKLSCLSHTKSGNAFQLLPRKTEITAQCYTQDQLIVDGKTYRYKDLQCKAPVKPSLMKTHETCAGPQSEMIRVGFEVNDFVEAYAVCYDTTDNVPLYANIPKDLSQRGENVDKSAFEWSTALELDKTERTGQYTCEASTQCCYTKGQLLNVNELPFGPAQAASFIENLNSVPIYNPCPEQNRTSWDEFEKRIAKERLYYETWSSWTGASKYVSKNHGLVPRYLWKVMNYEGISSAMVYVNDESPKDSDILCSQQCNSMMPKADKYLYCCTSEEFNKVFGFYFDNLNDVEST